MANPYTLPMRTHRELRVASVIREELAKLLLTEVDTTGALATVTEVIVDEKMVWADVLVSVLPASRAPDVMRTLERALGHLQHLLNKKLGIRPMPRLRVKLDHGLENAAKIEKTLLEEGVIGTEEELGS